MTAGRPFVVGNRVLGEGPAFLIAEAGVNHNGDLDLARRLVDAAADAGADAVKFQTFRSDALVSEAAPKARYQVETTGEAESQRTMLAGSELSRERTPRSVIRRAGRGPRVSSRRVRQARRPARRTRRRAAQWYRRAR